jgi:TatD DNase family protein
MLIDSHCHLDSADFSPEIDAVMARAAGAGVDAMLTVSTRLDGFAKVRAVAERFDNVWCSVGSHPHDAAKEPLCGPEPLIDRCGDPKVVGIGETGLDYFYDLSPREAQIANFRHHIAAARITDLPLIVHTRDADAETAAILTAETERGGFSGVLHCFSGGRTLAQRALDLGFYLSVSGMITFKKADELRAIVKEVPLDRLLVETDAPFLAPIPHRGARNEPSFVVHTAAKLAELKGVTTEEIARATTENFFRLFTKAMRRSNTPS